MPTHSKVCTIVRTHTHLRAYTPTKTSAMEILPQPVMNIFFSSLVWCAYSFNLRYVCGSVCVVIVHAFTYAHAHACVCACAWLFHILFHSYPMPSSPENETKRWTASNVRRTGNRNGSNILTAWVVPIVCRHWLVRPERETLLTLLLLLLLVRCWLSSSDFFFWCVWLNRTKRKTKILYKRQTLVVRCEWPCLLFCIVGAVRLAPECVRYKYIHA